MCLEMEGCISKDDQYKLIYISVMVHASVITAFCNICKRLIIVGLLYNQIVIMELGQSLLSIFGHQIKQSQ